MPIIWILIIGGVLYWGLRLLDVKHSTKSEKPTDIEQPSVAPAVESDVATSEPSASPDATQIPEPDNITEALPFIDTIPGLPGETKTELQGLELTTLDAISNAPDKKLLAVKGIGPARLKQIRGLCADAMKQ